MVRVLVVYGSRRGSTAEIADMIGTELRSAGYAVDVRPAADVAGLAGYDAVVLGGAVHAGHWARPARRFARREAAELSKRPLYMFSSGPPHRSSEHGVIPAAPGVMAIIVRLRPREHVTFGGRLARDAHDLPAPAAAERAGGDQRGPGRIRTWAAAIARELASEGAAAYERPREGAPVRARRPWAWPAGREGIP